MAEVNSMQSFSGENSFVFVSYCHDDYNKISAALRRLDEAGFCYWIDRNIKAGQKWSNEIAQRIEECQAILFFASKASCDSEYCFDELTYAKKNGKTIIMVLIEEFEIPKGVELNTHNYQRIKLTSAKKLVENLKATELLKACFCEVNDCVEVNEDNTQSELIEEDTFEEEIDEVETSEEDVSAETQQKDITAKQKTIVISACALVLFGVLISALLINFIIPKYFDKGGSQSYSAKMSDDWSDLTFTLDGEVYQLPCRLSVFLDRGWSVNEGYNESLLNSNISVRDDSSSQTASEIKSNIPSTSSRITIDGKPLYENSYIAANGEYEDVKLTKGDKQIVIDIYNHTGNTLYMKNCIVWGITTRENVDITVAKGLSDASTPDQITAALGVPTSRVSEDYYELLGYQSDDEKIAVFFGIFKNKADKENNFISLTYGEYKSLNVNTEVKQDVPTYLDDYVEPTALGNDITVPNVKVEGVIYTLPTPVNEFMANSWDLYEAPSAVKSVDGAIISLRRSDKTMKDVYAYNFSTYKHLPQHCVVSSITCNTDSNFTLVLPGNIQVGTDKATLDSAITDDFEVTEKDGKYVYKYDDNKIYNYHIEIKVDKESQKIESIKVRAYKWHYPKK